LGSPGLKDIFPENLMEDQKTRDERIAQAVGEWGYTQRELADNLGLHYSTVSRIIKARETAANKT